MVFEISEVDLVKKAEEIRKKERVKQVSYYSANRERIKAASQEYNISYRAGKRDIVLKYYGNGKAACIICGESRLACLSIDHIYGGGSKHRKVLGIRCSASFYRWLIKQGLPPGYQTLCMNCQFIKRAENHEVRRPSGN